MSKETMNNTETQKILTSTLAQAGELIMTYRTKYDDVTEKEQNEIVTPADIAANDYIVQQLTNAFPDIPIYSEEGEGQKSTSETRWILDPIDGTTPWVWGNSGFAISIALERQGKIALGAIYDPVMKELFFAEKGKGATRNGVPIKVAKGIPRNQMFMVVDWGNKDEKRKEGLEYFKHFFVPEMFARRIVPQWAPALGLCHLAEGRIHALVCNDTWEEDHAAGALIVQEAGGTVGNFYHPQEFNHREFGIIATNEPSTHQEIVDFLKGVGVKIS
jgi:myo-inositol-1(or 4)-monophosphatase